MQLKMLLSNSNTTPSKSKHKQKTLKNKLRHKLFEKIRPLATQNSIGQLLCTKFTTQTPKKAQIANTDQLKTQNKHDANKKTSAIQNPIARHDTKQKKHSKNVPPILSARYCSS